MSEKTRPHVIVAATDADLPADTIAVCSPVSQFADNRQALCTDCGRVVFHRPHLFASARKVCVYCFLSRYQADTDTVIVSEDTVREVALLDAPTKGRQ